MELANRLRLVWNAARKEIKAECGKDEKKLAMAEIFGLREMAQQIAAASAAADKTK